MLQHTFLLIYRNFKRFKSTFFINLIGLSTGLACTLFIYLWVNDELNFDKFHEKDNKLFQLMVNQPNAGGVTTSGETNPNLGDHLVQAIPEIEYVTVSTPPFWFPKVNLSVDDNIMKAAGNFVGKDYLNVFSYDLVQGDKNQVLTDKNSILLSEAMAMKLFNTTENIVGKTVNWHIYHFKKQSIISGIFKGTPANSSVQFDFLLSFDMFKEIMQMDNTMQSSGGPFFTYVAVKEGTDISRLNSKITSFVKKKTNEPKRELFLSSYSADYLYSYENGVQIGDRMEYVKLFSIIAVFILVIACINFMNLSTAKASRRIKEIGIKKIVGASRRILAFQYLGESMLMTFVSLFMAVLLVLLLLPQFNEITGKQLTLNLNTNLVLPLLGIAFITGLIAGSYPALYLSGFNPATVLKGKFNSSAGELWARKGLVVFQFTLSVVFIVSVLVVYKQIEYVQTKNLGYEKDHVIHFESEGKVSETMETFLSEAKKIPGIVNASSMVGNIVGSLGAGRDINWEGRKIAMFGHQVNYNLIETLGIKMASGRSFSNQFGSEFSKAILNEAAVKAMGLKDPLGKLFGDKEIIGIVKDFHFQSLHEEVKPMYFQLDTLTMTVMAKIEAGKEKETISRLEKFYKAYNPGFSFEYTFLDQNYQAQYAAENRVAVLSRYFAGLAILISCLGLFGLAAFTAERRKKEIGIRKVLGSSEMNIVYLLSGEFTKLVFVSILIALPLSYLLTRYWLDNFAYRITLEAWYFIGAGFAALLIAWLTVGTQAIRAARINPTLCLKDE